MWPCLLEGDQAETQSAPERGLREGDVVVARVADGLVIHRVVGLSADHVLLRGDNAAQVDPPIHREHILGIVARVRRQGRVLEAEEWKRRPGALRLLSMRIRDRLLRAKSP